MFLECSWIFNSFSPGRRECDIKSVNIKHNLRFDILGILIDITLEWMPGDLIDGKPTLFQVVVLSGNRPLTGPVLTQISVMGCHIHNGQYN